MTRIIAAITVTVAIAIGVILLWPWPTSEVGGDFYRLTLSYSVESGNLTLIDVDAIKAELPPRGAKTDQSNHWSFQVVSFSETAEEVDEAWANVRKEPGVTEVSFKVLMPSLEEGTVVVRDGDGKRLGEFSYGDLAKKASDCWFFLRLLGCP